MLNSMVAWREAALQVAKDEGKSEALISKIEKLIMGGKKYHDKVGIILVRILKRLRVTNPAFP